MSGTTSSGREAINADRSCLSALIRSESADISASARDMAWVIRTMLLVLVADDPPRVRLLLGNALLSRMPAACFDGHEHRCAEVSLCSTRQREEFHMAELLRRHGCSAVCATVCATMFCAASLLHVVPARAQTSADCNNNGIPDDIEFGSDYALWSPASTDGSGSMSDQSAWCPTPFTSTSRVVFQQPASSTGVGQVQFDSFWGADSLWFAGGSWKLIGDPNMHFDLYGNEDSYEVMRVVDEAQWDCTGYIGGPVNIGRYQLPGTLTVLGQTLNCYDTIRVGVQAEGTLNVVGGVVSAFDIDVGAGGEGESWLGTLRVEAGGTVAAVGDVSVLGVCEVYGKVLAPVQGEGQGGVLLGSGRVQSVHTNLLRVVPAPGLDADGVMDSRLTVDTAFVMATQPNAPTGTLEVRPYFNASGAIDVPSVSASEVVLGGLLRVVGDAIASFPVSQAPIVISQSPIVGNFAAIQPIGLPAGRSVSVTRSVDQRSCLLSIIETPVPPAMGTGQNVSLQRVAQDCVAADFDGDGDQDVAVVLQQDAVGKSVVRFLKTNSDGTQTVVGNVEFLGEARMGTSFAPPGDALPGVAVTLGSSDAVILLRNGGGWSFAPSVVTLLPGDAPKGIAAGAFLLAAGGSMAEIAVGCPGSGRIYILGPLPTGEYTARSTIEGVGGDIVRSGNADGIGRDDLVSSEDALAALHAITRLDDQTQGPAVESMALPEAATGLEFVRWDDSTTTRQSIVVSIAGGAPDPDNGEVRNIAVFLPAATGWRPPVLLWAGTNARCVSAGDINSDGKTDLGVVSTWGTEDQVRFLMNDSADDADAPLVFTGAGPMTGVVRPRIIRFADVDGNGDAEVVTLFAGDPSTHSLGPIWGEGVGAAGGGGCTDGDLDCDGDVDGADLGVMLGAWGSCSGCAADIDNSGVVDGADLGSLLSNWG